MGRYERVFYFFFTPQYLHVLLWVEGVAIDDRSNPQRQTASMTDRPTIDPTEQAADRTTAQSVG
jgi:hypothetical protein